MPSKFEKPPISSMPEGESPKEKVEKEKVSEKEKSERTTSVLSPENRNFFYRMSEKGRKIANQVYEGLYKIPGVSRIVGKMEIAYNQFWIDRYQEKAVEFKSKMDNTDLKIEVLDQSKEEIESVIENLKQQNIPGVESLQLKLQDIERQKEKLLNKKDRYQSKFEAVDNKIKLYTNKRDRIADKLISRYEEKLKPLEEELEKLQTYKDQIDLLIAVTKAKNKEQISKLNEIEKSKNQLEENLRKTGMREREIRKMAVIKELNKKIAEGQRKIKAEEENLSKRKAKIDKKIAKVDRKANPYRDKREEFVRIKERRPIRIEVSERKRGIEFKGEEEVKAHPRVETGRERVSVSTRIEAEEMVEEEIVEEKEKLRTAVYIKRWNEFLIENYKEDAHVVDLTDFLEATGLSEDFVLDFDDFKNILEKYLKYRKIPMDQFNQNIDNFYDQKIKT